MLCFLSDWCSPTDFAVDVLQFEGLKEFATVVTLVTACPVLLAVWTGAFYVSVWEEPGAVLAIECFYAFFLDKVFLVQIEEDFLDNGFMVRGRRPGEQVKGDAKLSHVLGVFLVVSVDDRLWRGFFFIRSDGDRSPMFVAAGDHQHIVSFESVEPGEDVCWEIASCDMSKVQGAICIGPGDADEYFFSHGNLF